jgi:hypothetical protein
MAKGEQRRLEAVRQRKVANFAKLTVVLVVTLAIVGWAMAMSR